MKKSLHIALVLFCIIYLINPTAGFFELIPDNIPFVGNLDEATAVFLLINSLNFLGIDVMGIFRGSKSKVVKKENPNNQI